MRQSRLHTLSRHPTNSFVPRRFSSYAACGFLLEDEMMSIHINTPKGADAAVALVNHCLRTANAKGLHADVLLSVGTSLAAELASQAPEARTAIALHLRNVADKIDGGHSINQSSLSSAIEAIMNVIIGLGINIAANFVILPLVGLDITLSQNLFIGVLYTVVSLVRSYAIRRWFNARLHAAAKRMAGERG